jgi:hypothetical protein
LTEQQILLWMDAYHKENGKWPTVKSGPIKDAPGESWAKVNDALVNGRRGLPGGSSLAQLLSKHRGVRNLKDLAPLSIELVRTWLDACHERTGEYPTHKSGPIPEAPGETWGTVDKALRKARRGFTVKSSLAQLLAEHRGVRNSQDLPSLSIPRILEWGDLHYEGNGQFPTADSGHVADAPGETWANIDQALAKGLRGLPGGSSLAQLLAEHRGVRNRKRLPQLSVDWILGRMRSHKELNGQWPTRNSGQVAAAPGETWMNIDQALAKGLRGLSGGSSLAKLLADHYRVRNIQDLPKLTVDIIRAWAEPHRAREGEWPTSKSGPIADAPGETWANVNQALVKGLRGLSRGSSLAKLFAPS